MVFRTPLGLDGGGDELHGKLEGARRLRGAGRHLALDGEPARLRGAARVLGRRLAHAEERERRGLEVRPRKRVGKRGVGRRSREKVERGIGRRFDIARHKARVVDHLRGARHVHAHAAVGDGAPGDGRKDGGSVGRGGERGDDAILCEGACGRGGTNGGGRPRAHNKAGELLLVDDGCEALMLDRCHVHGIALGLQRGMSVMLKIEQGNEPNRLG